MSRGWDEDEWRSAVRDMSEADRAASCGHIWQGGVCMECGERVES